jgi:PEP-CTERM motif
VLRLSLGLATTLTLAISLYGSAIDSSSFTNNATFINFDDLTGGACNLCGPSVTNQYASLGVTFSNPSFPGQDTADTNLTPLITNSSLPNALFVEQGGQIGETPAMPFQILFSVPETMVGLVYGSSTDSYLQLDAYDSTNTLLETLTFVGSSAPIGLAGFAGIQESTGIARLDVSYHPNSDPSRTLNFSIDNLRFEGSSVPEPSTLGLMAIGILGIAVLRRRSLRRDLAALFKSSRG